MKPPLKAQQTKVFGRGEVGRDFTALNPNKGSNPPTALFVGVRTPNNSTPFSSLFLFFCNPSPPLLHSLVKTLQFLQTTSLSPPFKCRRKIMSKMGRTQSSLFPFFEFLLELRILFRPKSTFELREKDGRLFFFVRWCWVGIHIHLPLPSSNHFVFSFQE